MSDTTPGEWLTVAPLIRPQNAAERGRDTMKIEIETERLGERAEALIRQCKSLHVMSDSDAVIMILQQAAEQSSSLEDEGEERFSRMF